MTTLPPKRRPSPRVKQKTSLWFYLYSFFSTAPKFNRRQNWKKRLKLTLGSLSLLALTVGWWLEWPHHIYNKTASHVLNLSGKAGFNIQDIMVTGRHFACSQKIVQAVNLKMGNPIFSNPLSHIKEELEKTPWVLKATVHRQLPHTLLIKLEERHPIAVWQHNKVHYLVDAEGVVISSDNLKEFSNLPIIVGGDAPLHAPKILLLLNSFPDIQKRITALVRVGGRRWDLQLDRKIIVKLPELKIEEAMNRLFMLVQKEKISAHNFSAVDLRLPNQIIMRVKTTEPLKTT